MFADFDGGQISRTDYFQSRDRDEGRAWLIVQGGCWHVLVPPHFNCRVSHALARPVVDHGEWEGWRWRLEIGGQRLQLPLRQILGYRPALPQPFTRTHRTLHLYASETARHSGQSFFGSVEPGVQLPRHLPIAADSGIGSSAQAACVRRLNLPSARPCFLPSS